MTQQTPKQPLFMQRTRLWGIVAVAAALALVFLLPVRGFKSAPIQSHSPQPQLAVSAAAQPNASEGKSLYRSTKADRFFLREIRTVLSENRPVEPGPSSLRDLFDQSSFPKDAERFALVIYQANEPRLLIVRSGDDPYDNIRRTINRALVHPRYDRFAMSDPKTCRLQIDFFHDLYQPVSLKRLSTRTVGPNRFEMGIDGLRIKHGKTVRYFLPGDAFVKSIMSMGQLRGHVRRMFKGIELDDLEYTRVRSTSFISYHDDWLQLFRGYPTVEPLTRQILEDAADSAVAWVKRTQRDDGSFLYYYDAARDSYVDHEHPNRNLKTNRYYNILRHSGGGLIYLFLYRVNNDPSVFPLVRRCIDYLLKQAVVYKLSDGREAAYIYYNRKAKLGGTGIGLYLLAEYQYLSGDDSYAKWATLLKNHLLNQIAESGEFTYYYLYLDKLVTEQTNQKHFSFYYPGEAVIGLATYYKYVAQGADDKAEILDKLRLAMNFLLIERPKYHKKHYLALPSDSWLMMGVKELWGIPSMRKELYRDFVFKDADEMVAHMYTPDDAPYRDYIGSFFYNRGDFPYADGARCEGLLGAFELAVLVEDKEKIARYGRALQLAAWATRHLLNTTEASYAYPNPEMALGGIRFKHTRQWFRIDTIQHVVAFYLKFLPYWENTEDPVKATCDRIDLATR